MYIQVARYAGCIYCELLNADRLIMYIYSYNMQYVKQKSFYKQSFWLHLFLFLLPSLLMSVLVFFFFTVWRLFCDNLFKTVETFDDLFCRLLILYIRIYILYIRIYLFKDLFKITSILKLLRWTDELT